MKFLAKLLTTALFAAMSFPASAADKPAAKTEKAYIGGGCFWCVEAQYLMLKGVKKVVSGYSGGKTINPTYEDICTGETGHAEVIEIEFDPAVTTFKEIVELFWDAHDPTSVTKEPMEKHGKFLPKGTKFVFQMHYAATGKEERDRTELGLYLSKEKPKYELRTRAVTQQDLGIPPGSREYPAKATYKFRKPAVLHNLSPHMHVRGSSFKYELIYPDGKTETLLSVPRWDFAWQTLYKLKEPVAVPAGAQLVCSGTFDNSAGNPANPDPKQWVVFGEQTTDEMFIGYYDIAVAPLDPVSQPKQPKEKQKAPAPASATN